MLDTIMHRFKVAAYGLAVFSVMAVSSCKKNNLTVDVDPLTPPTAAEFITPAGTLANPYGYFIQSTNAPFTFPVGITNVSGQDRTINFTVTSTTGATSGTQYTLNPVVIKAGTAVDSLRLNGVFAAYAGNRRDTLKIKFSGIQGVYTKDSLLVTLQQYCDVIAAQLSGDYTNTYDYYSGSASASKYTVTIANWTPDPTSATKATVLLKNFGATTDVGFGPFAPTDPATTGITANLDWTSPSNFTITIPKQNYVASLYTYGPSTISGSGTFSSCSQTFTVNYTVSVSAGNFTGTTTVLKR